MGRIESGIEMGVPDALRVLETLVKSYTEYRQVAETEARVRREIEQKEHIAIETIAAYKELLLTYLTRSFDERKENFVRLFQQADQALARGDTSQLGLTLKAITDLATHSPFKDIVDFRTTQQALLDPEHEWEL